MYHIYFLGCPEGSKTYIEGETIICYFYILVTYTWVGARDACRQFSTNPNADNADLAVIPSEDAKKFISDEFNSEIA